MTQTSSSRSDVRPLAVELLFLQEEADGEVVLLLNDEYLPPEGSARNALVHSLFVLLRGALTRDLLQAPQSRALPAPALLETSAVLTVSLNVPLQGEGEQVLLMAGPQVPPTFTHRDLVARALETASRVEEELLSAA